LKFSLPKIYPITDTGLSGLSHIDQVTRLIEGGASLIQLRDKTASSREFYTAAETVVQFARSRDARIIINDRVDIALAVGADGVHLGQDDLHPEYARKLLGEKAIIGFSTHSAQQARDAVQLPVDYIAIGPVFATSTKTDPDPIVGLDGVRSVRAIVGDRPLVAIGGIDRTNARSVLDAGADSVALIKDLVGNPTEIADRIRALLRDR
jgi:thiamine-phosphate pyrophosphorylase